MSRSKFPVRISSPKGGARSDLTAVFFLAVTSRMTMSRPGAKSSERISSVDVSIQISRSDFFTQRWCSVRSDSGFLLGGDVPNDDEPSGGKVIGADLIGRCLDPNFPFGFLHPKVVLGQI